MNVKYDTICGEACLLGYQDTTLAELLEAIDKMPNYSRWATTRKAILRAIDEGMPPSAPDTWPSECPHGGHKRSSYPEWDELRARLKEESEARKKTPPGGGGSGSGGRGPISHNILQDVTADQHHAQAHDLASHSTKAHAELSDAPADAHHPQLHEGEHRSGGGDELNHDNLAGFAANEHKALPATIVAALSDHDKAAHDALNIDADTVDGEEAADIVTDARVKAHFPDTIVNILSDHDKAAHDALNIDADTWDGHDLPALVVEKVLYNVGGNLSWWKANLGWLSDVNPNFITPYEACLLAYHGGNWVSAMPEYDIRYKSYQIEWEFWDASPPSPWASGALNAGTTTVGSGDDHPGFCTVRTRFDGDATNSGYYWVAANNKISVGGLEQMDFVFKTLGDLTGARWRLGFQDSITIAAPTDGIYFEMSADTVIRGVCRAGGVQDVTGTTYTLSTTTWYRGRIIVNAVMDAVEFKIYSAAGAELWSQIVLNHIPTGSAQAVGFGVVAWLNFDSNLETIISVDLADLICARGLTR